MTCQHICRSDNTLKRSCPCPMGKREERLKWHPFVPRSLGQIPWCVSRVLTGVDVNLNLSDRSFLSSSTRRRDVSSIREFLHSLKQYSLHWYSTYMHVRRFAWNYSSTIFQCYTWKMATKVRPWRRRRISKKTRSLSVTTKNIISFKYRKAKDSAIFLPLFVLFHTAKIEERESRSTNNGNGTHRQLRPHGILSVILL